MVTYDISNWESFTGSGPYYSVHDKMSAVLGKEYIYRIVLATPDVYATGGIPAKLKRGGLTRIEEIEFSPTWGVGCEYVESTDKIILKDAAGDELADSTDLNGLKIKVHVYGS